MLSIGKIMIGWICPKCGKAVNPNLNHCDCDVYSTKPYNPYEPYWWVSPYQPNITCGTVSDTFEFKINPLTTHT